MVRVCVCKTRCIKCSWHSCVCTKTNLFGTQKRLLSIRINELSIVKFFGAIFFFDFENFFLFLVERDRFFTLMDYSEPIRGSFVVLRKHLSLVSKKERESPICYYHRGPERATETSKFVLKFNYRLCWTQLPEVKVIALSISPKCTFSPSFLFFKFFFVFSLFSQLASVNFRLRGKFGSNWFT